MRQGERKTQLDEVELELASTIKKLELDIEHEERVTAEVESFLRDQHLEFSAKASILDINIETLCYATNQRLQPSSISVLSGMSAR